MSKQSGTKSRPQDVYAFMQRPSYHAMSDDDLAQHKERVRNDVVPEIKDQVERKEAGAHRARSVRFR